MNKTRWKILLYSIENQSDSFLIFNILITRLQPMDKIGPTHQVICRNMLQQLKANENSSLSISEASPDKVFISKSVQFTKICIDRERSGVNLQGKKTKTKIRTEIKKDKLSNSKETHIRKVFVTEHSSDVNQFIIREIQIDELSKKRYKEDWKLVFKVDSRYKIEDVMSELLIQEKPELMKLQL